MNWGLAQRNNAANVRIETPEVRKRRRVRSTVTIIPLRLHSRLRCICAPSASSVSAAGVLCSVAFCVAWPPSSRRCSCRSQAFGVQVGLLRPPRPAQPRIPATRPETSRPASAAGSRRQEAAGRVFLQCAPPPLRPLRCRPCSCRFLCKRPWWSPRCSAAPPVRAHALGRRFAPSRSLVAHALFFPSLLRQAAWARSSARAAPT